MQQSRMSCCFSGCDRRFKSSHFYHVTESTKAGGRDWTSLVGVTLCHACYNRYRNSGRLERSINKPIPKSDQRCSYEKCDRPDYSSHFYTIEEGKKAGGKDWSSLIGHVLCHACYKQFLQRGTLLRPRHPPAKRSRFVQNTSNSHHNKSMFNVPIPTHHHGTKTALAAAERSAAAAAAAANNGNGKDGNDSSSWGASEELIISKLPSGSDGADGTPSPNEVAERLSSEERASMRALIDIMRVGRKASNWKVDLKETAFSVANGGNKRKGGAMSGLDEIKANKIRKKGARSGDVDEKIDSLISALMQGQPFAASRGEDGSSSTSMSSPGGQYQDDDDDDDDVEIEEFLLPDASDFEAVAIRPRSFEQPPHKGKSAAAAMQATLVDSSSDATWKKRGVESLSGAHPPGREALSARSAFEVLSPEPWGGSAEGWGGGFTRPTAVMSSNMNNIACRGGPGPMLASRGGVAANQGIQHHNRGLNENPRTAQGAGAPTVTMLCVRCGVSASGEAGPKGGGRVELSQCPLCQAWDKLAQEWERRSLMAEQFPSPLRDGPPSGIAGQGNNVAISA